MAILALVIWALMLANLEAWATEADIRPAVRSVVTSKTLNCHGQHRFLRAIHDRVIAEHSTDTVHVEWLQLSEDGAVRSINTKRIPSPLYKGYVSALSFQSIDDCNVALRINIEMKAMSGLELSDVFLLSSDGTIRPVSIAGAMDLESELSSKP